MTSFATPDQLRLYRGDDVVALPDDKASLYLDLASNMIRTRISQQVDRVDNETITLDPIFGQAAVILPEMPVIDVTSVQVTDGLGGWTTLIAGEFTLDQATGIIRQSSTATVQWTLTPGTVQVTYSHGYDPVPDVFTGLCLSLAAENLNIPDGVFSESIGDYSARYALGRYANAPGQDPISILLSTYRHPVVA